MSKKVTYRSFFNISAEDDRLIRGQAVVYNSLSHDLGGFREIIAPGAISQELLANSDVVMNINHDDNIVLARYREGSGTLNLELRDDGLYFSFYAPPTATGDEILYNVRSGNLFECSFCFSIAEETWNKVGPVRTINSIDGLYDCSICTRAAYPATSVRKLMKRGVEEELEIEEINLEEIMEDKKEEVVETQEVVEEAAVTETEVVEVEEERNCGEDEKEPEEREESETTKTETTEVVEEEVKEEKEENRNINLNKSNKKMEKRFSLVNAINRSVETGEKINLTELQKRAYTVTDEGEDVVETDVYDIVEPLRASNVLVAAGCKFIGGMPQKNVQIPVMSATQVKWKGETATAEDGSGAFSSIELEPHRLTAVVPISLELLAQDTIGVEDVIRRDLVKAINDKLEASILGNSYGGDQPDGLAYILADEAVEVSDFGDICNLEAEVDEANVAGEKKYIVSPKFKAAMRSTIKGTNATGMIYENGEIDGTTALETSNVEPKYALYGKFDDLYICQFGDVLIETVRDTASLADGKINLVVNSFWDFAPVHEDAAFKLAYVS